MPSKIAIARVRAAALRSPDMQWFGRFVTFSVLLAGISAVSATWQSTSQRDPSLSSQPTIESAMARMQAQDFAGAEKILEAVVAHEPGNGRA